MDADLERNLAAILKSPSYLLAEDDSELLARPELRPVRMQLELLKPELAFVRHQIQSTIVVFGSTRISDPESSRRRLEAAEQHLKQQPEDPLRKREVQRCRRLDSRSHYYNAAREFSRLVSIACAKPGESEYVTITGGGPGIMEAANRGAYDAGEQSIGLNITLPTEQAPNPYITPELCFRFHYFALRKLHFLLRAKALVVFPGGFGTLDELFDALTLRQTQRMQEIPIIIFGREYWDQVIDFQFMADSGTIADRDLELFRYAETPAEAWDIIVAFHQQSSE
jgi:uncharacterized protein (TIGR00730 family)